MKKIKIGFTGSILFLCSFFSADGQTGLKVGDDAPPLHVVNWVKGEPIVTFQKGKVYVIEFTMIGCKPCREAIPHLSKLAQKYRKDGKVEVVSIFTAESSPDKPKDLRFVRPVQSLVNYMGDKMDYTVGVDVPTQDSRKLWGDVHAYPTVFIVNKDGKIAYDRQSGFAEMTFALESIVKTGRYENFDYSKTEDEQKVEVINKRWDSFNEELRKLKETGDYNARLKKLDTALTNNWSGKNEELLLAKFETYLYMGDSITANKYLHQVLATKKSGWGDLHSMFYRLSSPSYVKYKLPFDFISYLTVADHAIEEAGIPTLQAGILMIKASIVYEYHHNKAESLAILEKALKMMKQSGSTQVVELLEGEIKNIERRETEQKQANKDWKELLEISNHPTNEEVEKETKNKGNVAQHQLMSEYGKKRAVLAYNFWQKYPLEPRHFESLSIFLKANLASVPWVGEISKERVFELNNTVDSLQRDHQQYKDRNLKHYAAAYFRMYPLDLEGETEWVRKGNEMVEQMLSDGSSNTFEKESLEWLLFGRDWRTAFFGARNLPSRDERLEDNITRLERDYWTRVTSQYWESFWIRFNQHVEKYADLPLIADRATDFLTGTAALAPDLVTYYWQNIIDKYGNGNHPLFKKVGIGELCKRANEQLHIGKIKRKEFPVDMQFTAMDGREVDLAKYKGKIVLIDFWATWCKPCVGEMPALKAVYDKYHEKGFEMIGICLDEENKREEVKQLLAKNSLIGPQRFEGKGFEGDRFKQLYEIFSLPTVWLLDKDGMLVSTNARGEELERLLDKYLGESK